MVRTVIGLLIVIAVLASLSSFLAAKFMNQQEILRAKQEMEVLRAKRDSLETQVAHRDSVITVLERSTTSLTVQIDSLREQVDELERQRRRAEAKAFRLFKPEEYIRQFEEFYPEFAHSGWGFREIYNEEYQVTIEYFMIPTQFTTAFIQDHIDAVSYRKQTDKLRAADSLWQVVATQQQRIITLERENRQAYQKGYAEAFAKYEEINRKYIHRLENPQVKLGIPSATTLVGSAAVGFLVGSLVKNNR